MGGGGGGGLILTWLEPSLMSAYTYIVFTINIITFRRRRRPIVQSFGPDVHRSADTSLSVVCLSGQEEERQEEIQGRQGANQLTPDT